MSVRLDSVDKNDWDVVLIFPEQVVIRFDVYLFEGEAIGTPGVEDFGFGFVAEVAA